MQNRRIIKHWWLVLLHMAFWVFTAFAIINGFSIDAQEIEIINGEKIVKTHRNPDIIKSLSYLVALCFICFYLLHWVFLKWFNSKHRKKALLIGLIISLTCLTINYGKNANWFSTGYQLPRLPEILVLGISLFYIGTALFSIFVHLWLKIQKQQQLLLIDHKNQELKLLRQQLQPHFLFNALNNLMYLVNHKANPKLSKSLIQLSDLLRFSIEDSVKQKVDLDKEIDFLNNYIELQLLRFEENEIELSFSKELNENVKIEPGLLIPFVENAFKYGTEPETTMPINIYLASEKSQLTFKVFNQKSSHIQKTDGTNTGIKSIKKRLELVYPNKHQLNILDDDNGFSVELKLSFDE